MQKPAWFDWLTVAAIVLGPVLALLAQRLLDQIREKKNRRTQLYMTLMSTRAIPLAPAHIEALNSIDVVFSGQRDKNIRETWGKVLEHLLTDTSRPGWQERLNDLKVDLYQAIGAAVGYNFSIDYLKRQVYWPTYHADMERDYIQIRQMLAKALTEHGLRVVLTEQEPSKPASPSKWPPFGLRENA